MRKLFLIILSLFLCVLANAQTISNVRSTFSCPGEMTINYDLDMDGKASTTNVSVSYSTDNGQTYHPCTTVTGDLNNQRSGSGKSVSWNLKADGFSTGFFVFKVEPESCNCTVNSSLPVGKLTFLCYNLGADSTMTIEQQMAYVSAGNTDATVYGDLYQWGRPADGHEKRTSGITATLSNSDIPGHGDFITASSNQNWRSPRNDNLWGVPKTKNDPCPDGWRIPTQAEWASIYDTASGNTWEWNDVGTSGWKISSDNGLTFELFLPLAGSRSFINGSISIPAMVSYWTSTPGGSDRSYSPYLSKSYVNTSAENVRAYGLPCRCVKEY